MHRKGKKFFEASIKLLKWNVSNFYPKTLHHRMLSWTHYTLKSDTRRKIGLTSRFRVKKRKSKIGVRGINFFHLQRDEEMLTEWGREFKWAAANLFAPIPISYQLPPTPHIYLFKGFACSALLCSSSPEIKSIQNKEWVELSFRRIPEWFVLHWWLNPWTKCWMACTKPRWKALTSPRSPWILSDLPRTLNSSSKISPFRWWLPSGMFPS